VPILSFVGERRATARVRSEQVQPTVAPGR